MEVLLIRHAHAEEREDWKEKGISDDLRPLTKKGIHRFVESLVGLSKYVLKIDHIYTSQLTRAVQTADILHGFYNDTEYEIIEELNPDASIEDIRAIIFDHKDTDVIAFVGHQPELGYICSDLISEVPDANIRFKKGGMALLHFENGEAYLEWLLTQRQLIHFGKSDIILDI